MGYGIRSFVKRVVSGSSVAAPAPSVGSILSGRRHAADLEIKQLDVLLAAALNAEEVAKAIIQVVSAQPEKGRYIGASDVFLERHPTSQAALLIFIAENYISERNLTRCGAAARRLLSLWPCELTHILLARSVELTEGAAEEHRILVAGLKDFPDSSALRLNLIDNLIGTDQVAAANDVVTEISSLVKAELADEIATVVANQNDLELAMREGEFAPTGDADIYTDEFCRASWISYYESYVGRSERYHGDRMLLRNFVKWVESVEGEVDVILDFGSLCAQPLFEAALAAPAVHIVGTDRQKLLADLNAHAYKAPNLSFDFGDIFDVMARVAKMPGRKALAHVRTTCTLYPAFVDKLYAEASRLGFDHIYLLENAGFVRSQLQFLPFEGMEPDAVVTKHRLNYHNYHRQLTKHGYATKKMSRVRAPGLWRGDAVANLLGSQVEVHAVKGNV